jgi:hypothetical protein
MTNSTSTYTIYSHNIYPSIILPSTLRLLGFCITNFVQISYLPNELYSVLYMMVLWRRRPAEFPDIPSSTAAF